MRVLLTILDEESVKCYVSSSFIYRNRYVQIRKLVIAKSPSSRGLLAMTKTRS
jgi:hypothetical protein